MALPSLGSAAESLGDVYDVAVGASGDVLVALRADYDVLGALVLVRDGRARIVHRFRPGDSPMDVRATPGGFVGWNGFSEGGGGAFAVVAGSYRHTFDFSNARFGTVLTVPGVPFLGGLLVAGDGGIGPACRRIKEHSPCGALYRFDVHGMRVVKAFASTAAPRILAGTDDRAWIRTRSGLLIADRTGVRPLSLERPWELEPLANGDVLTATPGKHNRMLIARIDPRGRRTVVARLPFAERLADGSGFVTLTTVKGTRGTEVYATLGEQLTPDEAKTYRVLPAPVKRETDAFGCNGTVVFVKGGDGILCDGSAGVTYVSRDGTKRRLSPPGGAVKRAAAAADGSLWIAFGRDYLAPAYDPRTKTWADSLDNSATLVHFVDGKRTLTVRLPT